MIKKKDLYEQLFFQLLAIVFIVLAYMDINTDLFMRGALFIMGYNTVNLIQLLYEIWKKEKNERS